MTSTQKKVRENLRHLSVIQDPYLDLEVQDLEKADRPGRCSHCGFATEKGQCGAPWTLAEIGDKQIPICYEGISYYYSGIPESNLERLIDDGGEVPYLRVIDKFPEEETKEDKPEEDDLPY